MKFEKTHEVDTSPIRSKLDLEEARVVVDVHVATDLVAGIFRNIGCSDESAQTIAEHLADANLCGMESHGLMRTLQYVEQFESGYMSPCAEPEVVSLDRGALAIDGNGGHGVPAMQLALDTVCERAKESGMSVIAIRNVGHTGRLGAFSEQAANRGFLNIVFGGGGRENWRQVAPYGGLKPMLPTNPYSIGIPGGERGPVVLDFATSKIAGGWIYAARSAGAKLPDNVLMDPAGNLTRDPEDYFRGGAILPAGGAKGYSLALVAEILAEAMLGPTESEGNWLMINIDTTLYRDSMQMSAIAEEILEELRNCPPAPGFERVEIPGEREREHRQQSQNYGIALPRLTWEQIRSLASRLEAENQSR